VTPPAPESGPRPARSLHIDADATRLADVRAFVRETVAAFGGSRRATTEDLVQAVDEVTCNVILHGYGGRPGEIDIEAELRGRDLEIRILDRAPVFDPTVPATEAGRAAPAGPRRPGTMGVGLQLARTMTDSVRHHVRPDGGNELTLVRSIDDRAEED
jgi:anti-sigma regulatory factor (Ser/Thr protein kinase)